MKRKPVSRATVRQLIRAVNGLLDCLIDWMEIADRVDERRYDREAVARAHRAVSKAKEELDR
jgi:hypothetical protein